MNVPLLDLKAQYADIKPQIMKAIEEVVDGCYFINGPQVKQLENEIAAYSSCAAGVGVSSGTDAILCALMALGIGPGDEVITTPYTFFATVGCIARTGARTRFVDIDPQTFNIDVTKIAAAVTPKTKAIIPVHLFGQMADMDPIMEIARKHNLYVIEDAAQSIGATYKGRKAGSIGTAGCLSFYPTKNLGAAGDGGMIVTQDSALAKKLTYFRNHGSEIKYLHKWVGGNFRLDTLHAAVLLKKLPHLDRWAAMRQKNAAIYNKLFAACPSVKTPVISPSNTTVVNQYIIRVPRRDELQAFLKDRGIGTEIYYPLSMHQQECFADLGYKKGDFPNSEQAADSTLAIPIYSELTEEQITYVAQTIMQFYMSPKKT